MLIKFASVNNENIGHMGIEWYRMNCLSTVYPKKYARGFVVLCFEVFVHIHRGCFAGTGAIVRLPQCL